MFNCSEGLSVANLGEFFSATELDALRVKIAYLAFLNLLAAGFNICTKYFNRIF